MAHDEYGNNLGQVGVALTGRAAIAKMDANITIPTPAEGAEPQLTLTGGWLALGLRTDDGAPEWTEEPDGDAIEFFEDGYRLPTGRANVECKMTLAQTSTLVGELRTGGTYDENGYLKADIGAGGVDRYYLFTEEIFANGMIRRRLAERVTATQVQTVKPERGSVAGHEVTFTAARFDGKHHYHEWLIHPDGREAINPATSSVAATGDTTPAAPVEEPAG